MSLVGSFAILVFFPRLWDLIKGHVKSIHNLEENIDSSTKEMEELKEVRNDLKRKVDIAEGQMRRLDVVEGWLSSVEAIGVEVDELMAKSTQEVQRRCLVRCCPRNCLSSYKLGKKVAQKLEDMKTLRNKGVFSVVADRVPLPPVDERLIASTVGLESAFDMVWRCLVEEEVGIIGLYGMGGVGKITLLTQINNEFLKTTLDFVLLFGSRCPENVMKKRKWLQAGIHDTIRECLWKDGITQEDQD